MTVHVMLVDDHPVVRAGVRAVVEAHPDLRVVAEAADGAEALRILEAASGPVDVVLMDLQMGEGMDGVSATRAVRERRPDVQVLILTTFDTEADILAAVDAGAAGYLLKDAPSEEIARAVRQAAAGQKALAPQVAATLMGRMAGGADVLSAREIELLELIARGATNKAAAKELFISEATVKTHLVHVFQKLGVDNRTRAVDEARRRRIIR
ncbi:response regulator [Micrococcus endophyticus]|uniref:response regulator n=1 Tax=Micrococcus endophyticus TaxID=455343 RepID=UPI0010C7FC17|nr:response regulator transcription factor [Micrococcus endophyticus]MCK6089899.1 response regulator transcription factor [Micrococcus endophyticus]QCP07428.1 response regulator transcription factor [Micrococcus luteus]